MLILITLSILTISVLALLLLRVFVRDFRYNWFVAAGGAFFAWVSILFWQMDMPIFITLPSWQPAYLFVNSPVLLVDQTSWIYAFSLATLSLGVIFTSAARENFPSPPAWMGVLALSTAGILAVLAENPLTLVLAWVAIDIAELITLLLSVNEIKMRERVVISFSTRVISVLFLLWAGVVSAAAETPLGFLAAPPQAGIYMIVASGLRLGVLPMHMPFRTESSLRRGFGTMLRLTSAASGLVLLARIPFDSLQAPVIPYIYAIISLTALYSSWMWLRTPQVLDARPYWLLGMASLSLAATLRANPTGSIVWGISLLLGGGVLFLSSVRDKLMDRLLLISLFAISGLPFTLSAAGWQSNSTQWWGFWLVLIPAHALLLAGYYRHIQRATKKSIKPYDRFARLIYPPGIGIMIFSTLLLGFWGWEGALAIGAWYFGLGASILTILFTWLRTRVRSFAPPQAHWLTPATKANKNPVYNAFWSIYYFLRNLSEGLTQTLESDAGILWALLFILLFASLLAGGIR